MDYRRPVTQKRNTLALGTYPVISLEEARIKRDDAKKMLMNGIDPAEDRNANKEKKRAQAKNVFSRYAAYSCINIPPILVRNVPVVPFVMSRK